MKIHMSYAHADTHVKCSCRYTCHMLIQIHVSYAHETHMSYAHAGTHVICSCGYTSHMLTKIHMSAAYLLGCARCWSEDRVRSPRGSKPTSKTCDRGLRSDRYSATACILLAVVLATLCICSSSCTHHIVYMLIVLHAPHASSSERL